MERVPYYKLLGVWLTADLSCDIHIDKIMKKDNSRIHALRLGKRAGLRSSDIVYIYCTVIRRQVECESPFWSDLPKVLSDVVVVESVQKRSLKMPIPISLMKTPCQYPTSNLVPRLLPPLPPKSLGTRLSNKNLMNHSAKKTLHVTLYP